MNETPKFMLIRRDKNGFVTEEQWEELGSNLPILVGCIDSELELIDRDNWADWQSDLEKPDKYPYWRPATRTDILEHNAISYVEELPDSKKFNLAYIDIADAYMAGAEWADAHNPLIAYLEHEIERLKSKLQAADDLNTLLTAELEKKTPKGDEE